MNSKNILVSISCTTYNHIKYIDECLEGFIKQKCNFKFEILIHDDASTDGTIEIINDYQRKYPELIKPIIQKENQWSQGVRGMNAKYNFSRAKGKYIAMCEGDDYWTDPLKLQKQVDFLEENRDYSMVFTNANVKNEAGVAHHYTSLYEHLQDKDYSGQEIYRDWTIPTASIVFRTPEQYDIPIDDRFMYGDIILFLWLSEKGKVRCLNEKMVVYRRNLGGLTFQKRDFNDHAAHHRAIAVHFGDKYKTYSNANILNIYINTFLAGRLGKRSISVVGALCKEPHLILPFIVKTPIRLMYVLKNKFTN